MEMVTLTLSVLTHHHRLLGRERHIELQERGGKLGRSEDSDLVLPDADRLISKQHALIDFISGQFYITDTSVNGVYLNNNSKPLGKGNRTTVKEGDVIQIGDYRIHMRIIHDNTMTKRNDLAGDSTVLKAHDT